MFAGWYFDKDAYYTPGTNEPDLAPYSPVFEAKDEDGFIVKKDFELNAVWKQAIDVINQNVTRQVRFTFVKMLYKLAAVDEGIKYDEWLLLEFLLEQFKLNKSVATLYRRFAGLRSEGYNYKTYQSFSEKYRGASYAGNSSSSQGRTSSSRQGAPAPVSASLASAFAVLGLAPTASESEAQEAYHRLALLHHPDLPRNAERRAESVRIMAKINVAYAAITQNTK